MDIKEGGDKIYHEPLIGEPSRERTPDMSDFRIFRSSNRFTEGLLSREGSQSYKNYGQALRIAPREYRAYTKYPRYHAVVLVSVMPIRCKYYIDPEILQ